MGYLPIPTPHRRFTKAVFGCLLLFALGVGFVSAWYFDDPGSGVWASDVSEIEGVLRLDPVTFVETPGGPVLLVEIGKFGARGLDDLHDTTVRCSGTLLEREGRRMLELLAGDAGVASIAAVQRPSSAEGEGRAVVVTGEIIDTKCFLGAMKPGTGRGHAACARLCIRGGIPAAIAGRDDNGERVWAVIDPGESGVIAEPLLEAVGEPVQIAGTLVERDGLPVIEGVQLLR
ncbi:MAG: hypothetical protein AAFQ31_05735 [Planctomycetota bacterium]